MNKDVIKKWIKALRSGDYKQCRGKLHIDDRFCVLGVLCDLHSREAGEEWKKDFYFPNVIGSGPGIYRYRDKRDVLPSIVEYWSDMGDALLNSAIMPDGTIVLQSLSSLNDNGMSFELLANVIEKRAKAIDPSFVVQYS